jgi:hypothetical protein
LKRKPKHSVGGAVAQKKWVEVEEGQEEKASCSFIFFLPQQPLLPPLRT